MKSSFSTKVAFILAGAAAGSLLALLFARKSGRETRRYITDKAEEGKDYMTSKGREIRRHAEEAVDRGKDFVVKEKVRLAEALRAS